MQTASLAQDVEARAQVQVVGVAQYDLGLHLLAQLLEVYALHRSHRAYRHEDGGAYLAMVGADQASTGV